MSANGVPNQITMYLQDYQNDGRAGWHAFFAQEQWTLGRLTLQGAIRYDHAASWFPEQTLGPSKFFPNRIVYPATKGVDAYNDFTPRMGLAYDVFGNGKTALKVNVGRYLEGVGVSTNYANTNPTLRIPTSLGPFGAAGRDAGLDRRGQRLPARLRSEQPDDPGSADHRRRLLWRRVERAVGPAGPDQQLRPGAAERLGRAAVGLELRYLRPTADPDADVGGAGIPPPIVPRLHRPGQHAGGTPPSTSRYSSPRRPIARCRTAAAIPVANLFDITPGKFGQILNNVTDSSTFGDTSQVFDGVDFTVNLRQGGLTLQGGTSTGQTNVEVLRRARRLAGAEPRRSAPGCRPRQSARRARIATRRAAG